MPKDTHMKVKPIPVPLGSEHPDPKYAELPKHEFTIGLVAPKEFLLKIGGRKNDADLQSFIGLQELFPFHCGIFTYR
jgi:hypothetical protein